MKLSIDLGGTNIRIAQVEKGNCLNKVSVPCLAQQDASTVLNQLSQLIRNMMNEQVDGIGIGVPSIVDPEKGIVYNVANISSWKEIHLKEILENEFKVAVAINNDSNCFTLGESLYGEGKSYTNMVEMCIRDSLYTDTIFTSPVVLCTLTISMESLLEASTSPSLESTPNNTKLVYSSE